MLRPIISRTPPGPLARFAPIVLKKSATQLFATAL